MNMKLVAIGIIAILMMGGAYFLVTNTPNKTNTTGNVGTLSLQSWTYEGVSQDIGFQINKNVVSSGNKGVTGGTRMLDSDVFASAKKATVMGSMVAKIDFEYFLGTPTGWHQISQWWYKAYYKDADTDWRAIPGIDTSRRTFSPMQPGGLGGPARGPLTITADFSFDYYFSSSSKGGAVQVQTFVKLDTGEEFLIQTEEAYVYKEPMHLIIHTNPTESIVVIGEPAMSSNGWASREIGRAVSGTDGVAIFYLTNEQPGLHTYVEVSKVGYTSKTEFYIMTDHRDVSIDLIGTITTPPDETTGYTVTINVVPSGSQVIFLQENAESDIYGRKASPSQYVFENIQPGTYWADVSNYEWREGTYGELKWEKKEQMIKVVDQDVTVTITLVENTNPSNQPPMADQPTSSDIEFHAGRTYAFSFNFVDPEGDTIRTVEIDWGDGNMERRYDFLNGNLNTMGHTFLRSGTFNIKSRASTVRWNGDEYKSYQSAGLTDPFKFGDWSEPLTIDVIRVNAPPDLLVYYPTSGNSGAPGIPYIFNADGFDSEGAKLTYVFDWGDGTKTNPIDSYTSVNMEHIYLQTGSYVITVTVSDGKDTTTSTQLKDKSTGIIGTTFVVSIQKMPTPEITQMLVAGSGATGKAVIRANTMVPAHMFDVYVMVKDSKGTIVQREKIDKLFAGSYYVASLTFIPQNPGDVTVTAQLVPNVNIKGLLTSDAVSKTETSIGVGDTKVFGTPVIVAKNCIKDEPSQFTITLMTNYDASSFNIYAGVKGSDGVSVRLWDKTTKKSSGLYEYTATVDFTCHKVGKLTISTQAISSTESTKTVTAIIQCLENDGNPDWGGIYNPNNNTLAHPDLSGKMYDETQNTRKIPGFEMFMFLFAFAITVYLVRRKK